MHCQHRKYFFRHLWLDRVCIGSNFSIPISTDSKTIRYRFTSTSDWNWSDWLALKRVKPLPDHPDRFERHLDDYSLTNPNDFQVWFGFQSRSAITYGGTLEFGRHPHTLFDLFHNFLVVYSVCLIHSNVSFCCLHTQKKRLKPRYLFFFLFNSFFVVYVLFCCFFFRLCHQAYEWVFLSIANTINN